MAIVEVDRNGYLYWCVTKSETPTWRMFWDSNLFVQDLFENTEEDFLLAINFVFEADTKQECVDMAETLGLYLDPEIEGE